MPKQKTQTIRKIIRWISSTQIHTFQHRYFILKTNLHGFVWGNTHSIPIPPNIRRNQSTVVFPLTCLIKKSPWISETMPKFVYLKIWSISHIIWRTTWKVQQKEKSWVNTCREAHTYKSWRSKRTSKYTKENPLCVYASKYKVTQMLHFSPKNGVKYRVPFHNVRCSSTLLAIGCSHFYSVFLWEV